MVEKASYAEFPKDEYLMRLSRVRERMQSSQLDALFLTMYENLVYFAGYRTWLLISKHRPFTLLLTLDRDPVLFLPPLEAGDGMAFSWVEDVRYWPSNGDYISLYADTIKSMGLASARIGSEFGGDTQIGMSLNDWHRFESLLPDVKWVDASWLIWLIRAIKSPREIERMEQSCAILDGSVAACWAALRPGVTQRDLARAVGVSMMGNMADVPNFLIIRTGEDGWYMGNPPSSDKVVKEGDIVSIDIGCIYRDYHSDMIRLASLGEPSRQYREWHAAAVHVAQVVREATRPGITIGDLCEVRRHVTAEFGVPAAWAGIGHAIGLTTHELPRVDPGIEDSEFVLEPGFVFTVEPGLSYDGRICAIEDVVVVTETGHRSLTHAPRELYIASA